MLIGLRNRRTNELVYKDMLDIDFDMSVFEKDGVYFVKISRQYILPDAYTSRTAAEEQMMQIAASRNRLEMELRDCY